MQFGDRVCNVLMCYCLHDIVARNKTASNTS